MTADGVNEVRVAIAVVVLFAFSFWLFWQVMLAREEIKSAQRRLDNLMEHVRANHYMIEGLTNSNESLHSAIEELNERTGKE